MRCVICNEGLSDFEATRKYADSSEFVDMCNHCYSYVKRSVHTIDRDDLLTEQDHVELDTKYDDLDDLFSLES
jgi:hypothetical protein